MNRMKMRIAFAISGLMFLGAAARAAQNALDGSLERQSAQAAARFERLALVRGAPEAVLAEAAPAVPSGLKPSTGPQSREKAAEVPDTRDVMGKIDGAMDAVLVNHRFYFRGQWRSEQGPWMSLGKSLSSLLLAPAAYTLVDAAKLAIKANDTSPALVPLALAVGAVGGAIQGAAHGVVGFFMGGFPNDLDIGKFFDDQHQYSYYR